MRIRILGCSGGFGGGRRTSCLQVDGDILIDAGTGAGALELQEMRQIRHIFITHSHLDHIAGIPLMVDSIFFESLQPVTIHASPDTIDALQRHIFNWKIWPDFTRLPDPDMPVLRYEVMRAGETVEVDGRKIEMIPVNHVVPAVGYLVEDARSRFAFSGDTTSNDSLWSALNAHDALQALVVECAFNNGDIDMCERAYHYCPQLLAADLEKLRHRPKIYLSHLKPGAEESIFDECRAAVRGFQVVRLFDGDVIQL
jgi:cAMP phosphodiesterase